jgi:hypothetical protein
VAELAAKAAVTAIQLAGDEHAAADSGPHRDHHEVARSLGRPESRFAQGGGVPVVVDRHWVLGPRHHESAHVDAAERQVGAVLHRLTPEVDLRGKADADPGDLRGVYAGADLLDSFDDRVDDAERSPLGSGGPRLLDDTSLALDQPGGDPRAAHVEAYRIACAHWSPSPVRSH